MTAAMLRPTAHGRRLACRAGAAPTRRMPIAPERMPSLQLRLPPSGAMPHA